MKLCYKQRRILQKRSWDLIRWIVQRSGAEYTGDCVKFTVRIRKTGVRGVTPVA